MRLQIKALHDPHDQTDTAIIVVDGVSHTLAVGNQHTFEVKQGLSMNLKAVDGKGVPLGNTVSDPVSPKSISDPRQPAAAAPGGTQHEPTSPPNATPENNSAGAPAAQPAPVVKPKA